MAIDTWPRRPLEGYVSRDSVAPHEPLTIHVHSDVGPFRLQILRRGLADSAVASLGIFPDVAVDTPNDAVENGCHWPATTRFVIPREWSSGLYIVHIATLPGTETYEIPFVVKPDRGHPRTRILLAIASSTYEAYNWWGGRSLYGHGVPDSFEWNRETAALRVSTQRPYLSANDFAKPKFQYWELPFIRWLERQRIDVDFCTSHDLHAHPELLNRYELLVCVGHDEYWSWEMRDNVEQFVASGHNVAILSGNSVWWQIRFDEPDAITCYKSAKADPANGNAATRSRVTVNWTSPPVNRSEAFLTGVSFKYSGALVYGDGITEAPTFEVLSEHPLLANTDLGVGGTFGTYTEPAGGRPPWRDGLFTVIGYECDARPLPDDALNWRADWDKIIPVDLRISNLPGILFYDKSVGEGELYRMATSGVLTLLKLHDGWRRSWDQIVAGSFGGIGSPALLFYDRDAGVGEFYAIDSRGSLVPLREYSAWRQSWTQIVSGNFGGNGYTDLLFYDRAAGQAEFYSTGGKGRITLLKAHDGWRQSWNQIVPGDFGGDSRTDLLFYDRDAGVGEFYSTAGKGELSLLKTHSDWRQSWDRILALQFGTSAHSVLLLYDRDAGVGEFYATDGHGDIHLLVSHVDWRTTWRHIVPLKLDDSDSLYLFFYEDDTGYAELYSVNSAGQLTLRHAYTNPAFTLLARAMYQPPCPPETPAAECPPFAEYASLGVLRIGEGRVFTASTTDWSFGLSQSPGRWSAVDQITANLLHQLGSAPEVIRPIAS